MGNIFSKNFVEDFLIDKKYFAQKLVEDILFQSQRPSSLYIGLKNQIKTLKQKLVYRNAIRSSRWLLLEVTKNFNTLAG